MATRPATAPEMMPRTLGFLCTSHSENIQASAAAAVAIWVTVMAMPALTSGGHGRTGVEAEPADPQQRGADHAVDQVVRRHVLRAEPGALAEHKSADEARDAGVDMHDRATGEVEHAEAAEEAAAPHPMRDRAVDEDQPRIP